MTKGWCCGQLVGHSASRAEIGSLRGNTIVASLFPLSRVKIRRRCVGCGATTDGESRCVRRGCCRGGVGRRIRHGRAYRRGRDGSGRRVRVVGTLAVATARHGQREGQAVDWCRVRTTPLASVVDEGVDEARSSGAAFLAVAGALDHECGGRIATAGGEVTSRGRGGNDGRCVARDACAQVERVRDARLSRVSTRDNALRAGKRVD